MCPPELDRKTASHMVQTCKAMPEASHGDRALRVAPKKFEARLLECKSFGSVAQAPGSGAAAERNPASASLQDLCREKARGTQHEGCTGHAALLWEWCSGSSVLSARARGEGVAHLPPIDHRWGWHTGRDEDQLRLTISQVWVGYRTLCASPACHPWGSNSRSNSEKNREETRNGEALSLQSLARMCLVQVTVGRAYVCEQPEGSDPWAGSPLKQLAG